MKIVLAVMVAWLLLFTSAAHADWADDVQTIKALMKTGDYAGADRFATESLRKGPGGLLFSGTGTLIIHHWRGRARLLLGQLEGATQDANAIIQENSSFFPADTGYALRAMAKALAGDTSGSLADFQSGLAVEKTGMSGFASAMRINGIYGDRGIAYILLNDLPAAQADLSQAITADHDTKLMADFVVAKKESWTNTRAAIVSLKAGDLADARRLARTALQILTDSPATKDTSEFVLAQLVLNKLDKLEAGRVAVRDEEILMLAQKQLSSGDRVAAFRTYVRAYAALTSAPLRDQSIQGMALIYPALPVKPSLPEEARRYLVQARSYVGDKDLTQAIGLYDRAIGLAPWWPSSHFDRAVLLGELGQNEAAITSMKRFLILAPGSENAREGQDKIYEWELKLEQQQQARTRSPQTGGLSATMSPSGQSGCFIATAAYGSAMDPHVAALRQFRDTQLLPRPAGRWLVEKYYAWSPPVADFIRDRDGLRALVRAVLAPLVLAVVFPWQALVALVLFIASFGWVLLKKRRRV